MFRDRDRQVTGKTRRDHPAIEHAAADFSGKYLQGAKFRLGPGSNRRRSYHNVQSTAPPPTSGQGLLLDRVLVWLIDVWPEWERTRNLSHSQSEFLRRLIFSGWSQDA